MRVKIKDIPSGVLFRSLHHLDTEYVFQTFMLHGGYTLQTGKYVNIKNLTTGQYTYWDADIYVNTIEDE